MIIIDQWQVKYHQEQINIKSTAIINQCQIRLEGAITTRFNAVKSLAAFFYIHPETTPEEFAHFADKLIAFNPPIRAFQFADDKTRVTYVYPPKGNEITIQKPMILISDPKRGPFVKKAIDTKKATVHGPFELRQGGTGLILRVPIFIQSKFFGLAIGVFDVSALIQEAFIGLDTKQLSFRLTSNDGNIFYGSDQVWADQLEKTVIAGDRQWLITMKPIDEDKQQFYITRMFVIVCLGGILLLSLLFVYYQYSRSQRLQNLVNKQTRELSIKNQSLENEIEERKKAEKQRIQDQEILNEHKKLSFVGKIAGKMAHDFNNILSIIMGNSELSMVDCKDPVLYKSFKLILDQTLRGKNLTKNLVAFAKDQEPRQEFFKIDEKVTLVLTLLRKDLDGIELIREDKAGVPELLADSGMIEHAIINLLHNSIHAISKAKDPKIIVRTYSSKNEIYFEIEDNGCGIPQKHIHNIYDPAFTLKGSKDITDSYEAGIKGTGYGMANVKKYIDQHSGHISLKSKLNFGTKVTIGLPVVKKELTEPEQIKIRKTITQFNKYILLVEDESAISDIQYKVLSQEPCNHKVDIANDGQKALDLVSRNSYDLISLDYILPGQINGMDVYKNIRKTDKIVPILFVSGNIEFIESIKILKKEDDLMDHISKPCKNEDYIYSIDALLGKELSA